MVQLIGSGEEELSVIEPVVMEVFAAPARIFRRCRAGGITPRGMVDGMIAPVVWRHGSSLLAQDANLARAYVFGS
jgi:predicted nucleic acid-binding protein